MNKTTKFFQTVGQAIANGKLGNAAAINASVASASGVKYLHGNGPSPEWAEIPTERDVFAQYEPTPRTLTARLQDIALYRVLVNAGNPMADILKVMA